MDKIILAIDPGLRITGYSVLKHKNSTPILLDFGFLQLSSAKTVADRLLEFENFLISKIVEHAVSDLCIETPFLGKNSQTFLKLGFLRGILLLTAKKHNLAVHEFAPTSVKLAVTGSGNASKEQVARAVGMLFPQIQILTATTVTDVTDALAVALCGLFSIDAVQTKAAIFLASSQK